MTTAWDIVTVKVNGRRRRADIPIEGRRGKRKIKLDLKPGENRMLTCDWRRALADSEELRDLVARGVVEVT